MYYAPHGSAGQTRWGVVCTCLEPTQLVVAFAAHYIALGAQEVRLYLDAPQPDLEAILDLIPEVTYQVCDADYWAAHPRKRRPRGVEFRQLVNAYDAYAATDMDWLGHFDADEFVHTDFPISDVLAAQPKEVEFITVRPRERAFIDGVPQINLFDGIFRKPTPQDWAEPPFLYGRADKFLRAGVLSHPHGKSFFRTGGDLLPGIHSPRRRSEHQDIKLHGLVAQRTRLLHFDGLTGLHWSGKLLRAAQDGSHAHFEHHKARDQHRARQIFKMRRTGANLQNAWDMHQMLKCVPADQVHRLRALGLLEDYTLNPWQDIAALGLGLNIDLSRAGFDRALEKQTPQVADWLTEWESMMAPARLQRTGS